jgi:cyclophilin family peptidyl-prolyl cis-trans isomerase
MILYASDSSLNPDPMRKLVLPVLILLAAGCNPRISGNLRRKDLKKDVEIITSRGTLVVRLSDSTPLHRNNFLFLVKKGYYDSLLFHRVIRNFMIQAGDPDSRHALAGQELGSGGPGYSVPAEFRPFLFHHKGSIAAAREADPVNPQKASSGSQFYIVEGKKFSAPGLDSVEKFRLKGRKIPDWQRAVYMTSGGSPHLDQNYTVFGEVIRGLDIIDSIASVPTSTDDRPLQDIRIEKMILVRRSK